MLPFILQIIEKNFHTPSFPLKSYFLLSYALATRVSAKWPLLIETRNCAYTILFLHITSVFHVSADSIFGRDYSMDNAASSALKESFLILNPKAMRCKPSTDWTPKESSSVPPNDDFV